MGRIARISRQIEYTPLPSQRLFHDSAARFKGFSGPVGSGKSQALCQEAIRLSYQNQGRLGLIGAPTYPMLRDATQPALLEALEASGIPFDLNRSEQTLTFGDTRSKILFRAVEEFDRLRGTNLAWFGLDELTYTPEGAWLQLEARLRDPKGTRLCGFAVWTPKGRDWVWRRWIESKIDGYEVVQAKPYENRFVLDKVPDFYDRLKASYDGKFFEQEALGEYVLATEGLVYSAFDRVAHVRDVRVENGRPLLWALDFNVNPMSSVVAQRVENEVRVLDEVVLKRATTAEACEEFLTRYHGHMGSVVVYGDASGERMQTTGSSDYQVVREAFRRAGMDVTYRVPKANPAVRDRTNLMNTMLRDGRIAVSAKCKELIRDFEEVEYKASSTVIDKERDAARTHASDALGYLVWQEFQGRNGAGERGERLF
ncbi:MAG: terminase family protein [Bryobacteraceae bacterium]|nr:terminase family protein [Bryobacteraceae bacterium]